MIIVSFLLGLIIGAIIGARLYYTEVKDLEKRKSELSAMYYVQLDELTSKIEVLENKLHECKDSNSPT